MHFDWHGTAIKPLETLSLTIDAASPAVAIGLALRLMQHHTDAVRVRGTSSGLQRLETTITDA